MDDNLKDIIKIPTSLDDAVLKGLNKGEKQKSKNKYKKNIKKITTIAASFLVVIFTLGIINPELVSAIPIVNDIFDYFSDTRIGYETQKYKDVAEVVNKTVTKSGISIKLDKIAVDDNILVATMIVEGDKLKGYSNLKNPGDFININFDVKVNDKYPNSGGHTINIINDTKAAVVLEVNLTNLELEDNLNIDILIKGITRGREVIARNFWGFRVKTTKMVSSEKYSSNEKINDTLGEVWIDSFIKTPISNNLKIKGIFSEMNDNKETYEKLNQVKFVIKDNLGNTLLTKGNGGTITKSEFENEIRILNNLENVDYLDIYLVNDEDEIGIVVEDDFNVSLLMCTGTSVNSSNLKRELIEREPTNEELNSGYGLRKVYHYLNIDRNTTFKPIEDIIGEEVSVNNNDKVLIKNIEATDEYTKVIMEIKGSYNYENLSSLVIMDEDMKDYDRWEGHPGAILENPDRNEFSMTLGPIDKTKKYTIGIPMTSEVRLDENKKIRINLK